jgi:hypothetical protein
MGVQEPVFQLYTTVPGNDLTKGTVFSAAPVVTKLQLVPASGLFEMW